jgi:hypothetical protein
MTADNTHATPIEQPVPAATLADDTSARLFDASYHGEAGQAKGALTTEVPGGKSTAHEMLAGFTIDGADTPEPKGFFSRMADSATAAMTSVESSADSLGASIKDTANQAANFVEQHPLESMEYASGALVGGVVAVVAAPVELTALGVVGVAAVGAAAVDGAAYLLHDQIQSAFAS